MEDMTNMFAYFLVGHGEGGGADLGFGPKRIEGPGRKCLSGIRKRNLDRESAEGTKSFSG